MAYRKHQKVLGHQANKIEKTKRNRNRKKINNKVLNQYQYQWSNNNLIDNLKKSLSIIICFN